MSAAHHIAAVALVAGGLAALAGCEKGLTDAAPPPPLDEAFFRCHVQPILSKNCATFSCHGTPERYFRLYARNRLRLGIASEAQRNSKMNADERKHNFDAARAFIDVDHAEDSLILKKPVEMDAGGWYHGATKLGTSNIWPNVNQTEYRTIYKWIKGEKENDPTCGCGPGCMEPGENQ